MIYKSSISYFKKLYKTISNLISFINGDFAYNNYLIHHYKNHKKLKPLTKKDFLRKKQQNKWNNVNRCC